MNGDRPKNEETLTSASNSRQPQSAAELPGIWNTDDVPSHEKQAWDDYWERLDDKQPIFSLEAKDYVDRFTHTFADVSDARVLDFGCGFGLLSEAISPHVAEIAVWDTAANMRSIAYARLSAVKNVGFVDLSSRGLDMAAGEFDFILVNSVIQYMTFEELCAWLHRWKTLLGPSGRLVISDIMTHNYSFFRDLSAFLSICLRNGVLIRSIMAGIKEIGNYSEVKASRPLLRLDAAQISEAAGGADLAVEILPKNLTYHYGRLSAVFRKKE